MKRFATVLTALGILFAALALCPETNGQFSKRGHSKIWPPERHPSKNFRPKPVVPAKLGEKHPRGPRPKKPIPGSRVAGFDKPGRQLDRDLTDPSNRLPDLVIRRVIISPPMRVSGPQAVAAMRVLTGNPGSRSASGFSVSVHVDDGTPTPRNQLRVRPAGSRTASAWDVSLLSAGDERWLEGEIYYPADLAIKGYRLRVVVDGEFTATPGLLDPRFRVGRGRVRESNESNNELVVAVPWQQPLPPNRVLPLPPRRPNRANINVRIPFLWPRHFDFEPSGPRRDPFTPEPDAPIKKPETDDDKVSKATSALIGSPVVLGSSGSLRRRPKRDLNTGDSLKIATLNGQYLVPPVRESPCCDHISGRADKLARAIVESDYDVVALNEVFDSDVQVRLVQLLKLNFPHFVQFLDGDHGPNVFGHNVESDSGLMLFSRFPFVELPAGAPKARNVIAFSNGVPWRDVGFTEFEAHHDLEPEELLRLEFDFDGDGFANKGAGLVRIRNEFTNRIYNVVFTHLDANDDMGDVRARESQFNQIRGFVQQMLPADRMSLDKLILLGDLNVDGNLHSDRPEWNDKFGERQLLNSPGLVMRDAWEFDMHADQVSRLVRDPGLTSRAPEYERTEGRKRLDYVFHNATTHPGAESLRIQRMKLTYDLFFEGRTLSDHVGVGADINLYADYCSSREPHVVRDHNYDRDTSTAVFSGRLQHAGSMYWFRIDQPGTYSFEIDSSGAGVRYEILASHEMSRPLNPYRNESTEFLDANNDKHEGDTFDLPPGAVYYAQVFHPERNWTGPFELAVHRHVGLSREDALILPANEERRVRSIPATAIGAAGPVYFEIDTDAPFSGEAQDLEFYVNQSDSFYIELQSASGVTLLGDEVERGRIRRSTTADNRARRYLLVRPNGVDRPAWYTVGWTTNLTLLYPRTLKCIRQTDSAEAAIGIDLGIITDAADHLVGADDNKIRIQLVVDGIPVFQESGPDRRPNLGTFGKDTEKALGGSDLVDATFPCPFGFLDSVVVELQEDDDTARGADDRLSGRVERLPIGEVQRAFDLSVTGDGGKYRFFGKLKRSTSSEGGGSAVPGAGRPTCSP